MYKSMGRVDVDELISFIPRVDALELCINDDGCFNYPWAEHDRLMYEAEHCAEPYML